jgi:hypothetical protein
MSASSRPILLASNENGLAVSLTQALAERGVAARGVRYPDAAAALEDPPTAIVVAPALAEEDPGSIWREVANELTRNFELVQSYVRQCIANKRRGHVVALLPAAAAMGDPADSGTSALCGGMLSFVRTLALELRKLDMTVNAVFFESRDGNPEHAGELAALLQTLGGQAGHAITGQAIYACAGCDAGRLHP